MKGLLRLSLTTYGGVQDLSRVVNVLALLDLTPVTFSAATDRAGLKIDAWLNGDERVVRLCLERLRASSAIAHAAVTAPPEGVRPCATLGV